MQQVSLTLYIAGVVQHMNNRFYLAFIHLLRDESLSQLSAAFFNPQICKTKCGSHLRAYNSPGIGFGEEAHQGSHRSLLGALIREAAIR